MLIVWFFVYKKLAQFAVRGALPPRRSESPVCATDNKPSCTLHLLGWFIGSSGFSSLERRPEFWILHQQWPQDWKRSVFIPIPKKGHPKECSNYRTIALISHASKVSQASALCKLNFQMFELVLEKAEEQEIKLPTSAGSSKKQESSRKTSISSLLTMPKPLTVWITINCGKF